MGILGTDYNLRSVHAIFLLLLASSIILGFSYLNEMYQRIQLQENMEKQAQHIAAERSIIEHKAFLLQTQIENRNKEMKMLKNMHTFKVEMQNAICERERNDLLQTISSKNDTVTEVQTEYERLKQHFEHLRSVMEQFEKNQSRLLEKFSTQSTQCMNVINMLSKLCKKGNLIRKIAVTKHHLSTTPSTKDTTDNEKQSSLEAMPELQELFLELNKTYSMKDNEDEIIKQENIQNPTEKNVFKSQAEESRNDDETFVEKDQPNNMLIKETIRKKQTNEQQTGRNGKLPALKEASESEKPNQTKTEKVNNSHHPMLLSKDKSLQQTNQTGRTADKEVTDEPIENITVGEDNVKSEGKAYGTETKLDIQKKPQIQTLEKIKTLDEDIDKAKGESEYEHQRFGKDNEKQSSLEAMPELQELFSELNKTYSMKDNEDEIIKLENIQNPTEKNVFKSQAEEGRNDDETSVEKDQPNNMLIKETIRKKQTNEQQTGRNGKLPALKEASESEKPNQTKIEKVNNSHHPMLLSKDKSLQQTNQTGRTANKEVTDEPIENITVGEDNVKSESKVYGTETNLGIQKNPQIQTLEKIKTLEEDIDKAKGESEYEHQRFGKGLEANEEEILEIMS